MKLILKMFFLGGLGDPIFGVNLLVGLKQACILNLVEFSCVGAEKSFVVCGFVVCGFLEK